jgi:repressor LexA
VTRHGNFVTLRTIHQLAYHAVSTVSYHVSVLESEGSLRREPRQPRTITEPACPPSPAEDDVEVPLIGQIAAGVPLDAVEAAEDTFLLPWWVTGHCSCCASGATR